MATRQGRRSSPRFTIIVMVLISVTILTLDAKDVPVTLHYADGDASTTISVSDWAAGSPRFG